MEIAAFRAARLDLTEGDVVEVVARCGALRGRLRTRAARPGVLSVPFHYGCKGPGPGAPRRAADELIATLWGPVSKQPQFKTAAAALVERAGSGPGPNGAVRGAVSRRGRPRT
ncbi:molybdopterin dinucleotide binding domain-containing protein [Streptomyces sp. NPDC008122]|uniref:molybdopterin dinucleotide binding domain-containing protein n=1 Tax=Streptomyces sp. NPDC008122 TaxID=3364810 RepID=UPI0036EEA613